MQCSALGQLLHGVLCRLDPVVGTKTSSTAMLLLPVARMPVGNQSSIITASSRGTRNMWPSLSSPAGALKISHSEKSEPLQNPHCPVSR